MTDSLQANARNPFWRDKLLFFSKTSVQTTLSQAVHSSSGSICLGIKPQTTSVNIPSSKIHLSVKRVRFYPTALKGCRGIILADGRSGGP